jgi:hypothetical protein
MAVTLNASTSTGLVQSADTSGSLNIQSNGTTVLGVTSTGASVTGTQSVSGDLSFNSGYGSSAVAYGCRAWVNFNGTSTVAIRASGNVTSITDNGTGDYTVNFTTALVDANYTTVAQTSSDSGTQLILNINSNSSNNTTPTTTATRMYINSRSSGTATDSPYVNVSVFR